MLTTAHPVTEVVQHVYNVLANEACRHVLQELGILDEMDNHIYINSSLYNPSKSWDQNINPILVENKFTCTYDIRHASIGLAYETTSTQQHMDGAYHRRYKNFKDPILYDALHHIRLTDTVLPFNIPMNCVMTFRDHAMSHEIIDRMHLRFNKGEYMSVANLSYTYPLPLKILKALWALASTIGIDKCCFPAWMSQFSNGAITKMVTTGLTTQKSEWVVKRHVFETLIKIDWDPGNEPEGQGENSAMAYAVNFSMTLHASRPSVLYLDYPIIVANTLVPESIVHVDTSYQNELYKFLAHPDLAVNPQYQQSKFLLPKPVQNPWYDDWKVPVQNTLHGHLQSMPFFVGAFTLDEPNCNECPCHTEKVINPYKPKIPGTPYTPYGEDVNPYLDEIIQCHNWKTRLSIHFPHSCGGCPHNCGEGETTPYDECPGQPPLHVTPCHDGCKCYCRSKATTDINLDTDLDRYQLDKKVREYYRERKDKSLNVEDIYNIAVYVDDVQLDRKLLSFDGTVLKVSNALGPNHIYRLVLSKTRPRHVDISFADVQGDDPYQPLPKQVYRHPFFEILDCIIVPTRNLTPGDNIHVHDTKPGKPPAPKP